MDVRPVPGLEHLPYAEVWLHAVDDEAWQAASDAARAIGKTGLEVWTTTRTPDVVPWLRGKGYDEVRRYVISELDVAAARALSHDPRFAHEGPWHNGRTISMTGSIAIPGPRTTPSKSMI